MVDPSLCVKCKGVKSLCNLNPCPIKEKILNLSKISLKEDFSSSSSSVFIGEYGYPNVNSGAVSIPNELKTNNNFNFEKVNNYNLNFSTISSFIHDKVNSINSYQKNNIKQVYKKIDLQEISMSKNEVDLDVSLTKKPHLYLRFDQVIFPHCYSSPFKKIDLTTNPKIPSAVEKIYSDTDYASKGAIKELFNKNFDEVYLSNILSTGYLGRKLERKFVPTKWSITAVDNVLSSENIKSIKNYEVGDNYFVKMGSHFGNHFILVFLPKQFSYELFEVNIPGSVWNKTNQAVITTDFENFNGRKEYAFNTTGGYYAVRNPVTNYLNKIQKQYMVLAIRLITKEYYAPLGVWVVRQATKNAIESDSIYFGSLDLINQFLNKYIEKKFNYNPKKILIDSRLLKEFKKQSSLTNFFN